LLLLTVKKPKNAFNKKTFWVNPVNRLIDDFLRYWGGILLVAKVCQNRQKTYYFPYGAGDMEAIVTALEKAGVEVVSGTG
jgi:hypothetical protein